MSDRQPLDERDVADGPLADDLGGYRVIRELRVGQTYLVHGCGGREVIFKRLDRDCLLGGQLHPNIRERLSRVRELADITVANLYGVERAAGGVWMVWEYVPGAPLEQWAVQARSAKDRAAILQDVHLRVRSLHAMGIVHGALHERNVIIDPRGRVRLTHVSPFLYHETDTDEQAMRQMAMDLATCWGVDPARSEREQGAGPHARTGMAVGALTSDDRGESRRGRAWALVAALLAILVGGILALAIYRHASRAAPDVGAGWRASAAPVLPLALRAGAGNI